MASVSDVRTILLPQVLVKAHGWLQNWVAGQSWLDGKLAYSPWFG